MLRKATILTLTLTFSGFAIGGDWPQWRGPNRDGKSTDTNLLTEWPAGGPKLLWSIKDSSRIGTGYGSPAVVGDKLYLLGGTTAKQDSKQFVVCLNVKDGTEVWKQSIATAPGRYSDGWGGGPRGTPTVSGDQLFVLGPTGDLAALELKTGKVQWNVNLVKDFGGAIPTWGYSESVLVDGENVICTPGNKGGIVALNAKTGKMVWQCKKLTDGAGYSSIIVAEIGGVKQYIQQTMRSAVGVRAKDGELLWQAGEIKRATAVIPSPVLTENYVFFTAGYGAGCECFKLEKDGADGTKATKVYTSKIVANHHGGVIGIGDFVYGHSDAAGWVCFPMKTGEDAVWKSQGVGKGSISYADGYLYCYSERDGTLARVKPTEKGYEEAGKFTIPEKSSLRPNQGKVWAHPVIANGKLFLRDFEKLFVYDLQKPGA
jgi:outer membrane protein assembly factor BamB